MPLQISAPLPGPFRYTKQLDGKGTSRFLYWFFIGWWWMPMWWTAKLLWLGTVALVRLVVRVIEQNRTRGAR